MESANYKIHDRPKGWPACAARFYGGIVCIFYFCFLSLLGMYATLEFPNSYGTTQYFNDSFISIPFAFLVMYPYALFLNSGKVLAIKGLMSLYKIVYFAYFLTFCLGFGFFLFTRDFGLLGLINLAPAALIGFLFPYIRQLKTNCRWIDLSAAPEDWEPPYLAKDRALLQNRL